MSITISAVESQEARVLKDKTKLEAMADRVEAITRQLCSYDHRLENAQSGLEGTPTCGEMLNEKSEPGSKLEHLSEAISTLAAAVDGLEPRVSFFESL